MEVKKEEVMTMVRESEGNEGVKNLVFAFFEMRRAMRQFSFSCEP